MARQRQIVNQYAFNKGLVTDASPLAYPENTATVLKNMIPDIEGSLSFRRGLGLEGNGVANNDGHTLTTTAVHTIPRYCARWRAAAPGLDLVAVYLDGNVIFFKETTAGLQKEYKVYDVKSLAGVQADAGNIDYTQEAVQMVATNGALYATGKGIKPCYIKTNDAGSLDSFRALDIYERDFAGLNEDEIDPNERPGALSDDHRYNLINRGWEDEQIDQFRSYVGAYPALNDSVTLGYYVNPGNGLESWTPSQYKRLGSQLPVGGAIKGSIIKKAVDYGVLERRSEYFDVVPSAITASLAGTELTVTVTFDEPHDLIVGDPLTLNLPTDFEVTAGDGFGALTVPYWATEWKIDDDRISNTDPVAVNDSTPFSVPIDSVVDEFSLRFKATILTSDTASNMEYDPTFKFTKEVNTHEFTEPYSMTTVAFYAGRIWWAGQQSNRIGNRIYFSQILDAPGKAGRCHAEADPTEREINEVIDTDGGAISINDMGQVIRIIGTGEMLIVFSTNGVWTVFGRDGIFTATDYGQRKVGIQTLIHPNAVVDIGGSLCCWTNSGIYVVGSDGNTGLTMQNLTDGTLQGFLTREREANSQYPVTATYDTVNKTVVFQYAPLKFLALDFRLGAFSTYEVDENEAEEVADNNAILLPYFCEPVINPLERLKFLVARKTGTGTYDLLWHQFNSETYRDFADTSYFSDVEHEVVTGHIVGADAARSTIPTYVWVFMARIEGTDCTLQSRYNFSISGDSNKWSMEQRCYRDPPESTDVSRAKLRCRGEGKTFQLRFYSKGKPGKLLGWSMLVEQETDD